MADAIQVGAGLLLVCTAAAQRLQRGSGFERLLQVPAPEPCCPHPPRCAQAQTAELRASIVAIKALVGSLEAAQRERGEAGAAGAAADGGLTVAELRSELRSFAETLHE